MFCSKCGSKINKGEKYCWNCGAEAAAMLAEQQAASQSTVNLPAASDTTPIKGKNRAAVASLVLGIIGLIPVLGYIFSILAVINGMKGAMKQEKQKLSRVGHVLGVIGLFIHGIIALLIYNLFPRYPYPIV